MTDTVRLVSWHPGHLPPGVGRNLVPREIASHERSVVVSPLDLKLAVQGVYPYLRAPNRKRG